MQSLPSVSSEIIITNLDTDVHKKSIISIFLSAGCGCAKQCSSQFTAEHVTSVRASCAELPNNELDMAILGQLMTSVNSSSTVSTAAHHKQDKCKKSYTTFCHQVKPVCISMFRFLHGVGNKGLKNLTHSLKENGLAARVHGNTNKKPKYALLYTSTEFVVHFLYSYAEQHALLLPERIPGYNRTDIQLLP